MATWVKFYAESQPNRYQVMSPDLASKVLLTFGMDRFCQRERNPKTGKEEIVLEGSCYPRALNIQLSRWSLNNRAARTFRDIVEEATRREERLVWEVIEDD